MFTKAQIAKQRRAAGLPRLNEEQLAGQVAKLEHKEQQPRRLEFSRVDQLRQCAVIRPLTEAERAEMAKLDKSADEEAARTWQFEQLKHRRIAGRVTHEQFLTEWSHLTERFEREDQASSSRKKLLSESKQNVDESEEPKTVDEAVARVWKLWSEDKITAQQAAERAVAVRRAWGEEPERATVKGETWMARRRRMLTEKQKACAPDCDCADCDMKSCRTQLDEAMAKGQLTKGEAEQMWQRRLLLG